MKANEVKVETLLAYFCVKNKPTPMTGHDYCVAEAS
jgi:hypothetical protein